MWITSGLGEKKTIKLVGQEVAEHEWTATHRGRRNLLREGGEPGFRETSTKRGSRKM